MFDWLKQEAMRHGMKLMSNPKIMKMMSDPRLMNAITQTFTFTGRVHGEIESRLRALAGSLNLATKEDVEGLKSSLSKMEESVNQLEKKLG